MGGAKADPFEIVPSARARWIPSSRC